MWLTFAATVRPKMSRLRTEFRHSDATALQRNNQTSPVLQRRALGGMEHGEDMPLELRKQPLNDLRSACLQLHPPLPQGQ